MKPETKGFLKQMTIEIPAIILFIILVNLMMFGADMVYPGLGNAIGIGAIIALIGGICLALERGWLD